MTVPAGAYKARALDAALGFSSGGYDQVAVEFQITASVDHPDHIGARLTWYGYFHSDKLFKRTVDSLKYCGWKGNDLDDLTGIGEQEVEIVIEETEMPETGEVRSKIAWVNKLGGVALRNRMNEGEAKSFASKMRGKLLAYEQEVKQRAAAPAGASTRAPSTRPASKGSPHDPPLSSPQPAPGDDDIPF